MASRFIPCVKDPPWKELDRFRKLNGFVPHYGHVTSIVSTLNSLYGVHCKNESNICLGEQGQLGFEFTTDIGPGNEPRLIFDVPVSVQTSLLKCDILYEYVDMNPKMGFGGIRVPITRIYTSQDQHGSLVPHPHTGLNNHGFAAAQGTLATAEWTSTGASVGNPNQPGHRALKTFGGQAWNGFTKIYIYPDEFVRYYAFRFQEVLVDQLEDTWWDPAL